MKDLYVRCAIQKSAAEEHPKFNMGGKTYTDPYTKENVIKKTIAAPGRAIQNFGNRLILAQMTDKGEPMVISPKLKVSPKTKNMITNFTASALESAVKLSPISGDAFAYKKGILPTVKRLVGRELANPMLAHSVVPFGLAGAYGAYKHLAKKKDKSAGILPAGTNPIEAGIAAGIGGVVGYNSDNQHKKRNALIGAGLLGGGIIGSNMLLDRGVKNTVKKLVR